MQRDRKFQPVCKNLYKNDEILVVHRDQPNLT